MSIKFEESVVWDLPGRKHPAPHNNVSECECYYPGLPNHCYSYTPCVNSDLSYHDTYGNGGFGKSKEVSVGGEAKLCSRFYRYSQTLQANAFRFIGTGTRNDKMNLIGKKGSEFVFLRPVMAEDSGIVNTSLVT